MIKNILLVLACLIAQACANIEQSVRNSDSVSFEKINVVWEGKPRPIMLGADAQLGWPTLDDIQLLYVFEPERGNAKIYLAKSNDQGKTFFKAKPISLNNGRLSLDDGSGPQLAFRSKGNVFATWEENRDIKFVRSLDFGKSFSTPTRVNDDNENADQSFHSMQVAEDGTIFIFWLDGRKRLQEEYGAESVYLARSLDDGKTFQRNIRVSGNACHCCRPAIAFGKPKQVFLSWRHEFPGNIRKVVVASSQDNGLTWSKPIPVSRRGWKIDGCINSGPTMKYVNGKLYIAWYSGAGSRPALKLAWSEDEGASFHSLGKIPKNVSSPNYPDIQEINGEPWIIFQGIDANSNRRDTSVKAWVVKITSEKKITLPQPIPNNELDVTYPHLFEGKEGWVFALWTTLTNRGSEIIMANGKLNSKERPTSFAR